MWLLAPALAAPCPYGVNAHQAADEALELAADAGIGLVRFDMNWFQMEPSEGSYDWSIPDRFVDTAESLGLTVYVTVAYSPDWAVTGCSNSGDESAWCLNGHPDDPGDYSRFLTAAVSRYGDRVKHWGIWNEPNLSQFYRGTREQYTQELLVPGSDAVHAACSDCLVLGPDLANLRGAAWDAEAGTCVAGECVFNGWEVSLTEVLQDAGDSFDILTHHKYSDDAAEWWDELLYGEFLWTVQYMHGAREIIDDYGQGQPVWLTEVGWESDPYGSVDDDYAADQLDAVYRYADYGTWPELEAVFWYDLHDDPSGYSWGLLDEELQPTEVYDAYADVIAALGPCEADEEPDEEEEPVEEEEEPEDDEDDEDDEPADEDDDEDPDPLDELEDDPTERGDPDGDGTTEAPATGCATGGPGSWVLAWLSLVALRRASAPSSRAPRRG